MSPGNIVVDGKIAEEGLWHCDGRAFHGGGDFKGHVLPGTIFIVWGLHWLQGCLRHYFSNPHHYTSKATYGLPGSPAWPLEGVFKMALAGLGGWMELTFMKEDGYTRMICKPGTDREGHIDGMTVHNWHHFSTYPGFFISGALDLLLHFYNLSLPQDAEKIFLGLAFFIEGLLMYVHEKETPLDKLLHQQLALIMMGTALPVWAEVVWPHSLVATLCRVGGALGQGIVLYIIAFIVKGWYLVAWDETNGEDQAPAEYAAVVLVQTILGLQCVFAALVGVLSCRFGVQGAVRRLWTTDTEESMEEEKGSS